MARRDQLTRGAVLDSLETSAALPDFVHCTFHELVHARSDTSGNCPCCGSDTSKIVDDLPDFELLIDTVAGERYLRGPMFPGPGA